MKCITAALCLLASTTTQAYAQSSLEAGQERELGLLSNDCKEKKVCTNSNCLCYFKDNCDCDNCNYDSTVCGQAYQDILDGCPAFEWDTCCVSDYLCCVSLDHKGYI